MATQTRTAADLAAALADARAQLLEAVKGIPAGEMTKPIIDDWSVKDLLAHATSWDELGWIDFERGARGHLPALAAFKPDEIDDWNAGLMRGRRLFPLPQVLEELESRRGRLLDVLNAYPESMLGGPLVGTLVDTLVEHDTAHAKVIREWRQAAGI